ncbi:hypothetical protein [Teredinibacter purpureus]|uniref:hypothetical protein n=1 Tax=Teredinibacter purpureus TaxID=2731756 RepID=UPI000698A007|nr:hypothetical protein [Teredinibacter purpureus]
MPWTYVNHENDEAYSKSVPLAQTLSEADLPKTEFEARRDLAHWKMAGFVPFASMSWLDRFLDKERASERFEKLDVLMTEIKSRCEDKAYRSAIKRVVSSMPAEAKDRAYIELNIL